MNKSILAILAVATSVAIDAMAVPGTKISTLGETVSNEVVNVASGMYRPLGDEQVYASSGYSDFTYESDRQDALEAIGSMQPYIGYEYDDYCEFYMDFSIGPTNYYAYPWAPKNSVVVEFYFDGWYWDEDTGEETYDSLVVIGRRSPGGYVPSDPIDTFAHQSELTTMHSEITAAQTALNGETKKMRTGKFAELGTGWGYLQHKLGDDNRYWRIRVPKFGSIVGMTTNNNASSKNYRTLENYGISSIDSGSSWSGVVVSNLLSRLPTWDVRRTLVSTRGTQGTDAVQMADYSIGMLLWGTNGSNRCVLNYNVTHTSTSPMSFTVEPNVAGFTPVTVPFGLNVSETWFYQELDLPSVSFSYAGGSGSNYRNYIIDAQVKGVIVDPAIASTSDGTIPLTCYIVSDYGYNIKNSSQASIYSGTITNLLTKWTVKMSCSSASTLENVYATAYRILSTADSDLYYDEGLDETWRLYRVNGVFMSEFVMDGDWRKEK